MCKAFADRLTNRIARKAPEMSRNEIVDAGSGPRRLGLANIWPGAVKTTHVIGGSRIFRKADLHPPRATPHEKHLVATLHLAGGTELSVMDRQVIHHREAKGE